MSSIYGKKVVAVLDTQSNFGTRFQQVVDDVSSLSTQMSTLLSDAPESLDTLNEIAAALSDDPTFFSTMATANTTLQDNIDTLSAAAATARTTLQTALQTAIDNNKSTSDSAESALSLRCDALENDRTTATALAAVVTTLEGADTTLSGRLDILEVDPTTKTYVDTQISDLIGGAPDLLNTLDEIAAAISDDENVYTTLTNADTALSGRLDALELNPTTQTAVNAVQSDVDQNELDSDAADLALSNRLDVLEADPTTATALAAVQSDVDQNESDADAAIALRLPLTGGTLTGNLVVERDFPDFELCSNQEKRLIFTDAGGAGTAALKHVATSIDFFAGGIAGGDKQFSVDTTGVTVTNAVIFSNLVNAANDVDAAAGGVPVNGVYHNGGDLRIRLS